MVLEMTEAIVIVATGMVSSVLTFYVNEHLNQGAVRSSALLSLAVALFFFFFPALLSPYLTVHIPVVFIGASFIGMVSPKIMSNFSLLALAGLIFGLIYLNSSQFFTGFGGALGISACISILTVLSFPVLKSYTRRYKKSKEDQE